MLHVAVITCEIIFSFVIKVQYISTLRLNNGADQCRGPFSDVNVHVAVKDLKQRLPRDWVTLTSFYNFYSTIFQNVFQQNTPQNHSSAGLADSLIHEYNKDYCPIWTLREPHTEDEHDYH